MKLTALTSTFVKELTDFSYELSGLDRIWNILFPDQVDRWHYLHVNKYKNSFYISHVSGDVGSLEVEPNKGVRAMEPMGAPSLHWAENHDQPARAWEPLITSARKWLKVIRKDSKESCKNRQLKNTGGLEINETDNLNFHFRQGVD